MNITDDFGTVTIKTISAVFFAKIVIRHFSSPVCIGGGFVFIAVYVVPVIISIEKIYGCTVL
jgi:Gpi18-like mannosyltransferase